MKRKPETAKKIQAVAPKVTASPFKATKVIAAVKTKKKAAVAATVAPPAPAVEPKMDRRITPGTPTQTWRVVRGQRAEKRGKYLLQGGVVIERNGRTHFVVGAEETFDTLELAKAGLGSKQPAAA